MASVSLQTFEHAIQDAVDLLNHFDNLNKQPPPPPEAEVLKRASLIMALAALETYIEDRIIEAAEKITACGGANSRLSDFYITSLESDLKHFHTPSADRVKTIFLKYLGMDVTEGWSWNHCDQKRAVTVLNEIAKKRGDIAHRSRRPMAGQANSHAVTREELRKHIGFIRNLVGATDEFIGKNLAIENHE